MLLHLCNLSIIEMQNIILILETRWKTCIFFLFLDQRTSSSNHVYIYIYSFLFTSCICFAFIYFFIVWPCSWSVFVPRETNHTWGHKRRCTWRRSFTTNLPPLKFQRVFYYVRNQWNMFHDFISKSCPTWNTEGNIFSWRYNKIT